VKKETKQKIASLSLKRSAAGTKSPKSKKSREKSIAVLKAEVAKALAKRLAEIDSNTFLNDAIPLLRGAILRQMKENETMPENHSEAIKRARDSMTLSGLVRTLERLNALDKSREKEGKKRPRNDAELKEGFVRRLDQLLANGPKASVPGEPERG
jgi:hypothetical protein